MFRSITRLALPIGLVSASVLANAQVIPDLPNPISAPNPMTTTISIFRSNMQGQDNGKRLVNRSGRGVVHRA